MSDNVVLDVVNYSKSFILHEQGKKIPSSSNVNLKVYEKQLTALVGPTGSGKSSVLKGVYRSYLPGSGNIFYRKLDKQLIDLATADEHQVLSLRKSEIAFVTQFLHAPPRQSTENIVALPLIQRGMDKKSALSKARDILERLNVPARLWGISPSTFSGGEKQRVNLARGLLVEPRLLLLDEPTASLDAKTSAQVVELITEIKNRGSAILAIFHDQKIVEKLADYVVELTPPSNTNHTSH